MTETERLVLLLVKVDFPSMNDSELANVSPHQRRGYLSSVTRFLNLAKLFGYRHNAVKSDIKLVAPMNERVGEKVRK